ncbi:hypothetical protein AG4045_024327 [Apium graveolens]|uniref:PPC domain-containing protein n=1 Tax=Apium graveolens TaxID=4045 RepID=A0A6L5B9W5_APIGR|nr:hypothetical protein AG4045_024327 [Apium graveolens]
MSTIKNLSHVSFFDCSSKVDYVLSTPPKLSNIDASPSDIEGENSAMRSVILKVPAGTDIIRWVLSFAKENNVYITVQGGNVAVSEAHIRKDGVIGGAASKIITMEEVILSAIIFKNPQVLELKPAEIHKGPGKD